MSKLVPKGVDTFFLSQRASWLHQQKGNPCRSCNFFSFISHFLEKVEEVWQERISKGITKGPQKPVTIFIDTENETSFLQNSSLFEGHPPKTFFVTKSKHV
jgi:hypothetical protein